MTWHDEHRGISEFSEGEERECDFVECDLGEIGEDAIFAEECAEPGEENGVGHAAESKGKEIDDFARLFSRGSAKFVGSGEVEEPCAHPLGCEYSEAVHDPHSVGVGSLFASNELRENDGDSGKNQPGEEVHESASDSELHCFLRRWAPIKARIAGHFLLIF